MPVQTTLEEVQTYPEFSISPDLADGSYKVECNEDCFAMGDGKDGDRIDYKLWFTTPELDESTIARLAWLQVFAESHDQGFVSNRSAGNWTWFEVGIYENASATSVRVKDGVSLVWISHENHFGQEEYGWKEGLLFQEDHEMFGLLEPGNVIGVRLCARFLAWRIDARKGYIALHIASETADRAPPKYEEVVKDVKMIQSLFKEVNSTLGPEVAYQPSTPKRLGKAGQFAEDLKPLRVLSLDGGGVRGLISLYLLQDVMSKAAPGKKPCEVFDMIAGTSAGGLIAIMLGRLEMSIDECIATYTALSQEIFKDKKSLISPLNWDGTYYDATNMEKAFKNLVKKKTGDKATLLYDGGLRGKCKVFVTAVKEQQVNNREPVFLRSYRNPDAKKNELPNCEIWEAGRATSAAPVYFTPLTVDGVKLVDGGLAANNPIGWLWNEVLDVYGAVRSTACFLSIGTGVPANQALGKLRSLDPMGFVGGLSSIATNTQLLHILFKSIINAFAPAPRTSKYWRLNIGEARPAPKDPEDDPIGSLDDLSKIPGYKVQVDEYITVNRPYIEECAEALRVA